MTFTSNTKYGFIIEFLSFWILDCTVMNFFPCSCWLEINQTKAHCCVLLNRKHFTCLNQVVPLDTTVLIILGFKGNHFNTGTNLQLKCLRLWHVLENRSSNWLYSVGVGTMDLQNM